MGVASLGSFLANFGIYILGCSGHGACAQRFATGGLHRFIEGLCHFACGAVFAVRCFVMETQLHRVCIRRATGQQNLLRGHAAGDLRQACGIANQT